MTDAQGVAVTASFMTMGMCSVDAKHRIENPNGKYYKNDMYQVWDKGGIELHCQIAHWAEVLDNIYRLAVDELGCQAPGVFDYEVSEHAGEWLIEQLFANGDLPNKEDILDQLVRFCAKFFEPASEFEAGALYNKIMVNLP